MTTKTRLYQTTLPTTKTPVYTAPDRFDAALRSMLLSNITTAPVTVSLEYYKNRTATTVEFVKDVRIEGNSVVQIENFFFMEPKDILKASASVVASIVISIVVDETSAVTQGNI